MAKTALITGRELRARRRVRPAARRARRSTSCWSPATSDDARRAWPRELRGEFGVEVEVLAADLTIPRQRDKVVRRLQRSGASDRGARQQRRLRPAARVRAERHRGRGAPSRAARRGADATDPRGARRPMLARGERPHHQRRLGRRVHARSAPTAPCKALGRQTSAAGRTCDYSPRGVTVTAVCPGFTHTSFHERLGLPPGQRGHPRLPVAAGARRRARVAARCRARQGRVGPVAEVQGRWPERCACFRTGCPRASAVAAADRRACPAPLFDLAAGEPDLLDVELEPGGPGPPCRRCAARRGAAARSRA